MEYTTLSSLKKRLWIATDNTDSDTELSLIITRATNLIDAKLGFNLEVRSISERIDWTWSNRIYVKNKPKSITNIVSKDWYTIYTLDFVEWYVVYLEESTPKWKKNIIIDYDTGFVSVPSEIEEICLDLCVILANQASITWTNSDNLIDKNIKTQKLGELSITYFWETERTTKNSFESLDPSKNVDNILNKYKSFTWIS